MTVQTHLQPQVQHYTHVVSSHQARQHVPDWLQALQMQALARFQQCGFPQKGDENWRYAKLAPFLAHAFNPVPATATHAMTPAQLMPYGVEPTAWRVVLVNGIFSAALSHLDDLPEGADILPLAEALTTYPQACQTALQQSESSIDCPFHALNTALLGRGVMIKLADNLQLQRPIHIIHLGGEASDAAANITRQLVLAGQSTQALIIESWVSLTDDCYFTHTMTDIHCAANAYIEHVKLQQESPRAFHVGKLTGFCAMDSTLDSYSLALGGEWVRSDTDIQLNATNAACKLYGLFMGSHKQYIDHHTSIDHRYPRGQSYQHYRGILADKATGVFNGKVCVHKDAQQTRAEQNNHNILLSKTAQMNTKPALEIDADDVKCAHGATVGQLDGAHLFYLQSRGLTLSQAQHLLTYAFAGVLLTALPSVALNQYASSLLIAKMPDSEALKALLA